MALYELLLQPFAEFAFMRRALVASLALAFGCGPVGVLLVLRRMSLVGDAMSHAILPGAAVGFLMAGLSLGWMSVGGLLAGLAVALGSGLLSRATVLPEDASFAAFYAVALAAGVLLVSWKGSNVDLMHVLFGSVLAVDDDALLLIAAVATLTLLLGAAIYRPLVTECFDPGFLRQVGGRGGFYHMAFMALVVLNLVAAFQALGTLMAVGLMMLPAVSARLWATRLWSLMALSVAFGIAAGYGGLVLSFHVDVPSGPAIVLAAGALYVSSLLLGREGLLRRHLARFRHLEA
ncbi:MAG: metal ABC transporter permease [Alphaproteobacteria bacterium]|nr:metal ABC transporter permease [Alphaproteobacteria bacterium]